MNYVHAIALVAALLASGCDWRDFDNIKATTPVARVGSPSGYAASDSWGAILAAASPPADGSAAARFVSSAADTPAVGIISFDDAGHATGHNVASGGLDLLDATLAQAVTAMADVPGADQVLLGAPSPSKGKLLLLSLDDPYDVTEFFSSVEPQFGVGVAAGQLGGGAAPDFVVLSGNALHVFVDGLTTANDVYYTDSGASDPCPLLFSIDLLRRHRRNRAVAIGNFTGAGLQVAVGTPSTSMQTPGVVSIFNIDTVAGRATCALKLTGSEARFGQALAAGDFDGGSTDLLVGAPPNRAYLFRGPVTTAATAMLMPSVTGANFGGAVAAIDLDGDNLDEALIGDGDATVGSATLAGNVTIFKGPALATRVMPTPAVSLLTDRAPKDSDGYGSALTALRFCPSGASGGADAGAGTCSKLPLVGSFTTTFTYFTLGKSDPRVK